MQILSSPIAAKNVRKSP